MEITDTLSQNVPVPSIYSSASPWVGSRPAARNALDSARIPRASKLLICGLFQKGRVLAQDEVEVIDKGYRFDGKTYPSLTTIAKRITGTHWSGPRFFGLTPKRKA